MYLVKLSIKRDDAIIREICFKVGLNLILDKPTASRTQSGNSLGKTTVLRLIDYCLGSDGDDIWQDAEFKSINQEVFNFLHGYNPVSVALYINDDTNFQHEFSRVFSSGRESNSNIFTVDGNKIKTRKEYQYTIKQILFGTRSKKPTLRQLIPKFVRSSSGRMSNTLKFLSEFSAESDYEAVHLFLFGFMAVDVLEERPRLIQQKKRTERDLQALTRARKEGEIEQLLFYLRDEIQKIENSSTLKGEVPEISERATTISKIRADASRVAAVLSEATAEIATLSMTIKEIEADYSNIDSRIIEAVYREANRFIPELHHEWKDLTEFVSNLRKRKQRFLMSQMNSLQTKAEELRKELNTLQLSEQSELDAVSESPDFKKSLALKFELQEKYKLLGSLEQGLKDIQSIKKQLIEIEDSLSATKAKIEEEKHFLDERVAIFNRYFSSLSKILYGEQYLLHFDETTRGSILFQLTSVGTNVGSGKKMSQTAAFDLAYIQFLNETGINFPKFICHDGLESIHGNQLTSLLEIASKINGQFILATLQDKLPDLPKEFVNINTILELSPDDKLFRF